MITEGITPRVRTDLIGSLCDLTRGSEDMGTPVVFIQGYFDNLAMTKLSLSTFFYHHFSAD